MYYSLKKKYNVITISITKINFKNISKLTQINIVDNHISNKYLSSI